MYQVGQAVIIRWNKNTEYIGTFEIQKGNTIHTGGLFNATDSGFCNTESVRPATEAEILAEAAKHGWDETIYKSYESPFDYFVLVKLDKWEWQNRTTPSQVNLKRYCEEGLVAHRLIQALNLAK